MSLDARLSMEGIPALDARDAAIEVLHSSHESDCAWRYSSRHVFGQNVCNMFPAYPL